MALEFESIHEGSRDEIARKFPLSMSVELDFCLAQSPWPIAMREDYPDLLKQRVIAASAATLLGLKSVDYTMKHYADELALEENDRLDLKYANFLEEAHECLYELVHHCSNHDDETLGRVLFEWVMMRQDFSFRQLLCMANRGALVEGVSIARVQVEQLAWGAAVDRQVNSSTVKKIKAQSSIAKLKDVAPDIGKLYGFLSEFTHWGFNAQREALGHEDGKLAVVLASVSHKVLLYRIALIIFETAAGLFLHQRAAEICEFERGPELSKKLAEMIEQSRRFREEIIEIWQTRTRVG